MFYTQFTLGVAFYTAGFFLLFLGAMALGRTGATGQWLTVFPRSRAWGMGLLLLAAAWFWYVIYTIDLGEFGKWQSWILFATPVGAILTAMYVEELLAARALGMVLLLAAEPLLEAAFLQPEGSRLFLVVLAYVAIILAMFWIGMPYLLRDQIRWFTAAPWRLRAGGALVAGYGVPLLIFGLTLHRSA